MLNSDPNVAEATVGIIKSCFSSIAGTVIGVYVAQNCKGPNIPKVANTVLWQKPLMKHTANLGRKIKLMND